MKQFLFHLIPVLLFYGNLCAQPFKPDSTGFVNDPKFRAFIKDHSLQLVGRFDTLPIKQKTFIAPAIKNNAWIFIDVNGKEYPDKESVAKAFNVPYERHRESPPVNYSIDQTDDIPAPPAPEFQKDDEAYFEQLSHYQKLYEGDGKVGYSYDDREIIPPLYNELKLESIDGSFRFLAKKDSLWGVMDPMGKPLIPIEYTWLQHIDKGSPRLQYMAEKNKKWGILSSTGKVSIPFSDYYPQVSLPFIKISNNANGSGKQGMLDTNGRQIFPPVYSYIGRIDTYSPKGNHLFELWQVSVGKRGAIRNGIADFNGRLLLDTLYSEIGYFSDSIRMVSIKTDEKKVSGLFSLKTKQLILPCEYKLDDMLSQSMQYITFSKETDGSHQYGLISRKGKPIVPCIYSKIDFFSEDSYIVLEKDLKSGVYDLKMTEIVPMVYDKIVPISNGWVNYTDFPKDWFIFYKNGLAGVMNLKQEVKITNTYSSLEPSNSGLIYRLGDETGVIDVNSKKIVSLTGGVINKTTSGIVFWQTPQRQDILVDFYGNQVAKPKR